jgi:hypothetical protein
MSLDLKESESHPAPDIRISSYLESLGLHDNHLLWLVGMWAFMEWFAHNENIWPEKISTKRKDVYYDMIEHVLKYKERS